ncbi:MAG: hypothetical protein HYX53_18350 [Chloroflexi bacterium]|nr:hypothetical protein [Chloroflexota bacterium]
MPTRQRTPTITRVLVALAFAIAAVLTAAAWSPRPAFACSGPGALQAMLETPVIVEGRIAAVTPLPQDGVRPGYTPYQLTIAVVQGHRGAKAGDRLDTVAYLPDPGVPQACPSFEFQGDLNGQYLVIGLQPPPAPGGLLVADRAAASFVGAEPQGADYTAGHALAAMMTDSDPAAPRVTLVPPSPACGEPFRAEGVRFAPGKYVLGGAFDGRILALADVGPAGTFNLSARLITSWCSGERFNGRIIGLHVWAIDPSPAAADPGFRALTEIAPLQLSGARDSEPGSPVLRVTPGTARCGGDVTVTGIGFQPAERLTIGVGAGSAMREAAADAAGTISLELRLPAGECAAGRGLAGVGYTQVWATQAEFGLPGPYFSLASGELYLEPLAPAGDGPPPAASPAPGPPDTGSGVIGPGSSGGASRALILVAITILASMSVPALMMARRSRRRAPD